MSWAEDIRDTEDVAYSDAILCPEWDRKNADGTIKEPCVLAVRSMEGSDRDTFDWLSSRARKKDDERIEPRLDGWYIRINGEDRGPFGTKDEAEENGEWFCGMRARLLVLVVVDHATKEKVFKPEDWEWLTRKNGCVIGRLYAQALEFNRITPADVEELKKTSVTAPSVDSGTPSPAISA